MMKYFQEQGFVIEEYEPGIYHIKRRWHPDMQIIVSGILKKRKNL